jgi:hypothetical protein
MNTRITVCIDCDEDHVLELEQVLNRLYESNRAKIKNWDIAVDELNDDDEVVEQ